VAGAVELVTPVELQEPLPGEPDLEVRVEVSVVLLSGGQQLVGELQELLQPGFGLFGELRVGQRPADRLDPLVEVAVQEGEVVDVLAGAEARRELEVGEVAGLVQPVPSGGNADVPVGLAPVGPEAGGDDASGGGAEGDPAGVGETDWSERG
jgi:hypothetical protein